MNPDSGGLISLAPTQIYITVVVGVLIGATGTTIFFSFPFSNRNTTVVGIVTVLGAAIGTIHYTAHFMSKLGSGENEETHHHHYDADLDGFQPKDSSGSNDPDRPDD